MRSSAFSASDNFAQFLCSPVALHYGERSDEAIYESTPEIVKKNAFDGFDAAWRTRDEKKKIRCERELIIFHSRLDGFG